MTAEALPVDSRRGMILVIVLWSVALMTVVVVALSSLVQTGLSSAGLDADRLRSRMALEAGVEIGMAMVLARRAGERAYFEGTPVVTDIGGNRLVEIAIRDTAGFVDVNRADVPLIAAAAAAAGATPQQAQSFADNILADRTSRSKTAKQPGDLVATAVEGKETPLPPAYVSMAQLYDVPGVDSALIDRLLPLVTLYSSDGKVNPMAAPDAVLQAVPALPQNERQRLLDARERRQGAAPDVVALIESHANNLALNQARVFQITVRLVSGPGIIVEDRIEAAVLIDDGAPVRVLSWSW